MTGRRATWMRTFALVTAGLLLGVATAEARTIVGTAGNDRLVGTPSADTLAGRAGNDQISGVAGPDLLIGGPGRDSVDAGAGNDRVSVEYDGGRDSARCGDDADVVNADSLDAVAGDCELVGRRLSRDPYGNPDSQHETEVEPDSLTFRRTTVAAFQVGRRFDGAATNIGYAVTTDNGRSWTSGLLPGLRSPAARPARARGRAIRSSRTTQRTVSGSSRRWPSTGPRRDSRSTARRTVWSGVRLSSRQKRSFRRGSPSTRTGSCATTLGRRRSTGGAT